MARVIRFSGGNANGERRSTMELRILGCGDAFGSGGRNQSGYLVYAGNRRFLLDCGPTTLPALKRAGIDPADLDAIFISHLHGDHFAGVPFFFIEFLHRRPPQKPLQLAGPPGTESRVAALFQLMYGSTLPENWNAVNFLVLQPDIASRVADIQIHPFRVPHQEKDISLGMRIAYDGKQLLYSGDSAWTPRFIEEARGVDLFLCECSFYDEGSGNHVRYLTLREYFARLECKTLVLTHMGSEMLERKDDLPGTFAEDGMVLEI